MIIKNRHGFRIFPQARVLGIKKWMGVGVKTLIF